MCRHRFQRAVMHRSAVLLSNHGLTVLTPSGFVYADELHSCPIVYMQQVDWLFKAMVGC
jgi:hypothetical protein